MDTPEDSKSKGILRRFFKKSDSKHDIDLELPEPPHALGGRGKSPELEIDKEIQNIQKLLDDKESLGNKGIEANEPKPPKDTLDLDFGEGEVKKAPKEKTYEEPKEIPKAPAVKPPVQEKPTPKPAVQKKPTAKPKPRKRPKKSKAKKAARKPVLPKPKKVVQKAPRRISRVVRVLSKEQKGKIILTERRKLEKDQREFKRKQKKLTELEKKVKKREKEMLALEKKVKKNKSLLDKEEISITRKIKELEKHESRVTSRQKTIQPRLENIEQNESFLKKKISELNEREKQIIIKEEEAKKNDKLLVQKEKDLVKQVQTIELDKKAIEDKSKEIDEIYKKIEQDKRELSKKEKSIDNKIAKVGQLDEDYKQNMAGLEAKEQEIQDQEKKLLEKENKAKEVILESQKNKVRTETVKKMDKTYKKLKQHLKEEYDKLEQIYNRRIVLEKGGTLTEEDMAEMEQLKQKGHGEQEQKEMDKGHLQDFVDKTSQLISQGSYVEANKYLALLISKHHQLGDESPFKKELYYDILRLKHELKLALLK